jgi:hypothetical protein
MPKEQMPERLYCTENAHDQSTKAQAIYENDVKGEEVLQPFE